MTQSSLALSYLICPNPPYFDLTYLLRYPGGYQVENFTLENVRGKLDMRAKVVG